MQRCYYTLSECTMLHMNNTTTINLRTVKPFCCCCLYVHVLYESLFYCLKTHGGCCAAEEVWNNSSTEVQHTLQSRMDKWPEYNPSSRLQKASVWLEHQTCFICRSVLYNSTAVARTWPVTICWCCSLPYTTTAH